MSRIFDCVAVMRYFFAIASLSLACCFIILSRTHPAAYSWACRQGLCPIEQVTPDAAVAGPATLVAGLTENASDPYLWSDYADSLAASGDLAKASAAFEQAVRLGPKLPPILIRAAYFAFSHSEFKRGATLSNRVLTQTSAFDPLVFSYLHYFGHGRAGASESGIPASIRPAHAWALWISGNGSEAEIKDAIVWLRRNRLLDQPTVLDLTWKLWQRQFFGSAQALWSDWLQSTDHGRRNDVFQTSQLLSNRRFEREPDGSPFDWTIPTKASVAISRDQGLNIRFLGAANVKLDGIQQSVIVKPGRYKFSVVIESDGLTTDQRPFFRIFDPRDSNRFNIQLPPIAETTPESEVGCELIVPRGSEALTIELVRRPSERFDNKIEGMLHIYEVSFVALGDGPMHADLPAARR